MNEFIISFMIISLFALIFWIIEYINKKRKLKNLSDYSFSNSPHKILKEEDHVICFLFLKNGYFLSGQMNGMISVYNYKDFSIFALILEHCEPITSLFEMNDGKILTTELTSTGYYVVEINEKYTAEMYSEYANWIPAIVSQLKSLYSLIESAFTVITKKENKLMKEINASSKIKEIK